MSKIIGKSLPNIPWQEKPQGYKMPVWRYTENPIIGRNGNKISNSVFNSAVVPFEDGFAGVFRCDSRSISMDIFVGRSKDGIHWDIEDIPIRFDGADEEILNRQPVHGNWYPVENPAAMYHLSVSGFCFLHSSLHTFLQACMPHIHKIMPARLPKLMSRNK